MINPYLFIFLIIDFLFYFLIELNIDQNKINIILI